MTFCALFSFLTFSQNHPELVIKKTLAAINPMQVTGRITKNTPQRLCCEQTFIGLYNQFLPYFKTKQKQGFLKYYLFISQNNNFIKRGKRNCLIT